MEEPWWTESPSLSVWGIPVLKNHKLVKHFWKLPATKLWLPSSSKQIQPIFFNQGIFGKGTIVREYTQPEAQQGTMFAINKLLL